ncbi:hypothetical protein RND81_14G144800 [Saponaria officinalis]|uniref:Retrotransposon gag domain-containing protein n=1 Tax=Saponaria officinalis TaxID=3572 RepID=A0AAW1GSI9_SAPOF
MRWILNALSDTIAESLSYVTSSKQLWDELAERFNQSNAPYLYQLRKKVVQIFQGDSSVAEYYSRLKSVWEDIRSLDPLPECSCGVLDKCSCNLLKKIVDRDNKNNLIDFLMGLDCKFEHIRGQILAMDPLPSVNQAFAKVYQTEVQKNISNIESVVDLDGMAMVASQFSGDLGHATNISQTSGVSGGKFQSNVWTRDAKKPRIERVSYHCDFCNKNGYTKEFCWKLKGQESKQSTSYTSFKSNNFNGRKFVANVEETSLFEGDTPCDQPSTTSRKTLICVSSFEAF